MKKTNRLGALLGIGASLVAGCNLEKRAWNETKLYYYPREKIASIWAVDYDGVKEVTLSDSKRTLARDPLEWTYINCPHMVSVPLNKTRLNEGLFLDGSIQEELPDGSFYVGVLDCKGNYSKKRFTKSQDKIKSP